MKIQSIDVKQYIDLLRKNYAQLRYEGGNLIPSKIFTLDINKQDIRDKGLVPKGKDSLLVDQMRWRLIGGGLYKSDLALMDVIASNNWERPIYFNFTSRSQIKIDLSPYTIEEGLTQRLLPIRNPDKEKDFVNTEVMYDNMVNKFQYRELDNPKVYYNDDYRGFVLNHRSAFNTLAQALVEEAEAEKVSKVETVDAEGRPAENKMEKARKALLFSLEKMPDKTIPYDHTSVGTVELLFKVGEKEKAIEVATTAGDRAIEMAGYIIRTRQGFTLELRRNMYVLAELQRILYENGESELGKKFEDAYVKFMNDLQ